MRPRGRPGSGGAWELSSRRGLGTQQQTPGVPDASGRRERAQGRRRVRAAPTCHGEDGRGVVAGGVQEQAGDVHGAAHQPPRVLPQVQDQVLGALGLHPHRYRCQQPPPSPPRQMGAARGAEWEICRGGQSQGCCDLAACRLLKGGLAANWRRRQFPAEPLTGRRNSGLREMHGTLCATPRPRPQLSLDAGRRSQAGSAGGHAGGSAGGDAGGNAGMVATSFQAVLRMSVGPRTEAKRIEAKRQRGWSLQGLPDHDRYRGGGGPRRDGAGAGGGGGHLQVRDGPLHVRGGVHVKVGQPDVAAHRRPPRRVVLEGRGEHRVHLPPRGPHAFRAGMDAWRDCTTEMRSTLFWVPWDWEWRRLHGECSATCH